MVIGTFSEETADYLREVFSLRCKPGLNMKVGATLRFAQGDICSQPILGGEAGTLRMLVDTLIYRIGIAALRL
ncbi:hypothetical protein NDU88_001912 [Pleurodeles waltl]|uniref:Uncharacterized protein n=1 Tax=Pleurodeles waltl TaxID=8319 RepID=A0AAV7UBR8_PLEWA|nr:hypothetical protein NDU88_001912 [Pleurodeles waltl]